MPVLSIVKQPYEICFSRNPLVYRFKVTPFGDDEINANTRISVSLYMESEHFLGDFREIKQCALRPDMQGFAEIDFCRMVDSYLDFYVPKLGNGATKLQEAKGQMLQFYVRYALIDDYVQLRPPVNSDIRHALKGGLPKEQLPSSEFFATKVAVNHSFLDFPYAGETVSADEPRWIYFLIPFDLETGSVTTVVFKTHYESNILTYTQNVSIPLCKKWTLFCLPVGVTQQNLTALAPAGPILKSVSLKIDYISPAFVQSDMYAERELYRLDYKNYYDTVTLHYHNSAGGFDTQVIRGEIVQGGNYDKENITLLDSSLYAAQGVLKPSDRYNSSRERATARGNTGWAPVERMERLRDLLKSDIAYENLGAKLKPVQIDAKDSNIWSNREKLYSMNLNWQDAYQDQNFAPKGYLPPNTSCPEMEFMELSQQVGLKVHVAWQLPEGYETVSFHIQDTALVYPAIQYILQGNSGEADLEPDLNAFPPAPSGTAVDFIVTARVVCELPSNYGPPMSLTGPFSRYAPPIARNDYGTTYKGSGARVVTFNGGTILSNDTARTNPGGPLSAMLLGSVGSGGGTFSLNPTTFALTYTPVNANYTGVDVIAYLVSEVISPLPLIFSAPNVATIYVKVEGAVTTGSYTGKPYVKLVVEPGPPIPILGFTYMACKLRLYYYTDPLGTQPMNMTGLGVNISIQKSSNLSTYPNINVTATGTTQVIGNQDLRGKSGSQQENFAYALNSSANYFIL